MKVSVENLKGDECNCWKIVEEQVFKGTHNLDYTYLYFIIR